MASNDFKPEEWLTFVELEGFSDDWKDLSLGDDDLMALQLTIIREPKNAPVVPGTGGLRKLRFAPARWKRGKRGAVRVCYVYFQEFGIVLLVIAYAKGERDDIPAGHKKVIRDLIRREHAALSRRMGRRGWQ